MLWRDIFHPLRSTQWLLCLFKSVVVNVVDIHPMVSLLQHWSWVQRPSALTAAWRPSPHGRMRSTSYCGRRSSRRTCTCGGSPTTPSTGTGAGRLSRYSALSFHSHYSTSFAFCPRMLIVFPFFYLLCLILYFHYIEIYFPYFRFLLLHWPF